MGDYTQYYRLFDQSISVSLPFELIMQIMLDRVDYIRSVRQNIYEKSQEVGEQPALVSRIIKENSTSYGNKRSCKKDKLLNSIKHAYQYRNKVSYAPFSSSNCDKSIAGYLPIKFAAFSVHIRQQRKLSIQQTNRKESIVVVPSKQKNKKDHARSNSTLSKKSFKQSKNCLKIDLSKLTGRHHEKQNKIVIQQKQKQELQNVQIGRNHFQFDYVIGKGGFGKVWSVAMKKNGQLYAMKQMNKSKIIAKKSIHSVLNERQLLSQLKHPFLVNMSYAFQDREKLYLVMDLLVGGDLRYHMGVRRRFRQSQAKFFIACILIGLEFLHLHNIIHRDIKPENLVFDDMGYLRITDLGIARIMKPNNSSDTSGTPGYMAPQVMCRQDHSFSVDYYAVGIIAYQLMLGRRPYNGRNRKEIRDQILSKQVQIKPQQIPSGWSPEAANFINRMIQRKTCNRLGSEGGMIQIKDHPWFKGFPWGPLLKKNVNSPFIPKNILGSEDYRDQISETSEDENEQENMLLLRKQQVEQLFSGYTYYSREQHEKKTSTTTKYSATTANTHGSYIEDKQKESHRNPKPKTNNFFKA